MPIDRPDGRHWCAPDAETPDADGAWVCPGCEVSWTKAEDNLWMHTEDVPDYRLAQQVPVAKEPE